MMNNYLKTLSLAAFCGLASCAAPSPADVISVLPRPNQIEMKSGSFSAAGANVCFDSSVSDPRAIAQITDFADQLSFATGAESAVCDKLLNKGIRFSADAALAEEEYSIDVTDSVINVKASSFYGFLYSIQTLKQLLPAEFFSQSFVPDVKWEIPAVSIKDKPRFGYRGVHLDDARHIFGTDEVKKYLDVLALHKVNRFHWHLTEDQGWRVEIKKYPKLTEIGAYRDGTCIGKDFDSSDGIRYGGFYTQEEMREIVAYADALGITVIPEIDLPGHMLGALAAYPELGCTGGPYEVWQRWGISDQVLCPGKEKTLKFLEDVLSEIIEIFPSEYIHIGGDECPKTEWENCPDCQKKIEELGYKDDEKHTAEQYLQSYVTARIQKFLNSKGRKIIGWDEILEGELAKGATVMSWRGTKGGIEAASKGFDAIMTPSTYCYFDYYQSEDHKREPFGIGGHLPVDQVYSYSPLDEIPADQHKHILGVQCNLWTEYISTPEHLEYMLLPRMDAICEVQWCQPEIKDFERFEKDIQKMMQIYDYLGYTYSRTMFGEPGLPQK